MTPKPEYFQNNLHWCYYFFIYQIHHHHFKVRAKSNRLNVRIFFPLPTKVFIIIIIIIIGILSTPFFLPYFFFLWSSTSSMIRIDDYHQLLPVYNNSFQLVGCIFFHLFLFHSVYFIDNAYRFYWTTIFNPGHHNVML